MNTVVMLSFLILVATCVYVWAGGHNYIGQHMVTNTCDTLNDTASGSGLAEVARFNVTGFDMSGYSVIKGKVKVQSSSNSNRGYGLLDSAAIYLVTEVLGERKILDSARSTIPCSLLIAKSNDTLFGGLVGIDVYIVDTTSDTVMTATHNIDWDITLRE